MNYQKLLKETVMPVAIALAAFSLNPFAGVEASAAPQELQQGNLITGTVVDETGETVIGATVIVVGGNASQGVITDLDGQFQIDVKPGTQLQISYIGYETVTVAAKNGMKVVLKEEANTLQAVEVVAYGVQKKVTVTGAISSVKSEELTRTPVSSVNNVLAGQLSGVTTVQTSGEPGADAADIFVRGKATFTGDANARPLIQVDGVEREMWDIDPNEIESITVLKDASATAVFGVRGANGVILITTKRGQEGKAHISFSTSFSALTPTKMVEQASSLGYATFYNQMLANDRKTPLFSDAVIQKFTDGSDPILFPSVRWTDYLMKDVTLQQQHNVNISGGNKKVRYFISAGMFTQDGIFKEFDRPYDYGYQYERFNYRSNLDLNVTNTTTVSFNISGKVDTSAKPHTGQGSDQMIREMYWASPFSSPGIVDGKYIVTSTEQSDNITDVPNDAVLRLPIKTSTPMAYYITQPGAYHYNNNKLQMDLVLDQKLDMITKGLSAKLKGSYNSSYQVRKEITHQAATYTPVYHRWAETDPNQPFIIDEEGNEVPNYIMNGSNYVIGERLDLRKSGDDTEPTYVIRYAHTSTSPVSIPEGCTLDFRGGNLRGIQSLTFNGTLLKGAVDLRTSLITENSTIRNLTFNADWVCPENKDSVDCTPYVQCIIDAFPHVIFPEGDFLFSQSKNNNAVPDSERFLLKLSKNNRRIEGEPGAVLRTGQQAGLLYVGNTIKVVTNIRIQGITFYCENSASEVRDVEHLHTIGLYGVKDVTICGCRFKGYYGDAVFLTFANSAITNVHVRIVDNHIDGMGQHNRNGISIDDGTDILICNNLFENTSTYNDSVAAIDFEPPSIYYHVDGVTIISNHFCTCGKKGAISLVSEHYGNNFMPISNVRILNNEISNCSGGIFIKNTGSISNNSYHITGNYIIRGNIAVGTSSPFSLENSPKESCKWIITENIFGMNDNSILTEINSHITVTGLIVSNNI